MILTAEKHPLTWRLRADGAPVWLDEYQRQQGYEAVRKSIGTLAPQDVTIWVRSLDCEDGEALVSLPGSSGVWCHELPNILASTFCAMPMRWSRGPIKIAC